MLDPKRWTGAAGTFILEHTKVAYLIWVLLWFLMLDSLWSVAPRDNRTRFGVMAWVAVAELVMTPLFALRARALPLQGRELLLMMWLVAQVPIMFSAVSVLDGAPAWLSLIAFIEALCVMGYSVGKARQDVADTSDNATSE